MKQSDLFSLSDLKKAIEEKHVRAQSHPTLPYTIWNYTEQAMWNKAWTDVTTQCRGLITDILTGEVIARPFPKFFNYGEYDDSDHSALHPASLPTHKMLDLTAEVQTTDKLDGSLGILYPTPQGHSIATRGSFTSEQAVRASFLWHKRRYNEFPVPEGWTMLFEIIYPGNRIVVDYRDADDLYLLGAVNIETGESIGPDDFRFIPWQGPKTTVLEDRTLLEALHRTPRPNAEGIVVRYMDGPNRDLRVKIKQDDYVALHRIITGMNERAVWERLGDGDMIEDVQRGVPEEFWPWIAEVGDRLQTHGSEIMTAAFADFESIKARLPQGWDRKAFAEEAVKSEYKAYMFMLLDGRDIRQAIWKSIKPSGAVSMKTISEDVA
jgi:RNA ligase